MPTRRAMLAAAALAPALGVTRPVAARQATPADASAAVTTRRGVVYGLVDGVELLLDAYLPPARDKPRPGVILIHGEGWSSGSRSDMGVAAKEFATAGYVAFSIDHRPVYGGATVHTWPAQLDDAQRAVRWVRAHAGEYGVDPGRIAAYGWSTGGHLAAMLGVRDTRDNSDPALAPYPARVNCVVTLGADLDWTVPQIDDQFRQDLADYLGGTLDEQPESWRDASPLAWVDAMAAPFLIVHGGLDDALLAGQSRHMAAALYESGVEAGLVALPGLSHSGIWIWDLIGPLTLAFVGMQLHPER